MDEMTPVKFVISVALIGMLNGLFLYFIIWVVKGAGHFSRLLNPFKRS